MMNIRMLMCLFVNPIAKKLMMIESSERSISDVFLLIYSRNQRIWIDRVVIFRIIFSNSESSI